MVVWVVIEGNSSDDIFRAVCSSEELARKWIVKHGNSHDHSYLYQVHNSIESIEADEE